MQSAVNHQDLHDGSGGAKPIEAFDPNNFNLQQDQHELVEGTKCGRTFSSCIYPIGMSPSPLKQPAKFVLVDQLKANQMILSDLLGVWRWNLMLAVASWNGGPNAFNHLQLVRTLVAEPSGRSLSKVKDGMHSFHHTPKSIDLKF